MFKKHLVYEQGADIYIYIYFFAYLAMLSLNMIHLFLWSKTMSTSFFHDAWLFLNQDGGHFLAMKRQYYPLNLR